MTPSAAPLVLLYRGALRYYGMNDARSSLSTRLLLSGYLKAWLAFSVCAAWLQKTPQPLGLTSHRVDHSRITHAYMSSYN